MEIIISFTEEQTIVLAEAVVIAVAVSRMTKQPLQADTFAALGDIIKKKLVDATAEFLAAASDDEVMAWGIRNNVDIDSEVAHVRRLIKAAIDRNA